jgi:dienelactone hydrolase
VRTAAFAVAAALLVCAAAPPDDPPKGEDVRFTTSDGCTIAATYWPPAEGTPLPAPAVVALPMFLNTRSTWAAMARPVIDRGMGLLALDLRGHGGSSKPGIDDLGKSDAATKAELIKAMHLDVEAAIAWLEKRQKTPPGKVALLGAGVGGGVAIDTAVRNPDEVAAVACLSPDNALDTWGSSILKKWPHGKRMLLVTTIEDAAGCSPFVKQLTDDVQLRIVGDQDVSPTAAPRILRGTYLFGHVADLESNVADWLALHVAFRRIDLGGGVTAVVGSTGSSLYVGVEADPKTPLDAFAVKVGLGPVTEPWSKASTIVVGKRLGPPTEDAAARRRTRVPRDRLGAESGKPFAVQVSLDGEKFLPDAGAPALLFSLR